MTNIAITGASGQLGQCFKKLAPEFDFNFIFLDSSQLDIANSKEVARFFLENKVDYCINCAAYTQVEKAEEQEETAFTINARAVGNLAKVCASKAIVLFHFSTDYVFNGKSQKPYLEEDAPHPLNVYGASKLKGEENIKAQTSAYFIFRTSWLYSQFGHNFYKTILKKAEEGQALKITAEQTGTPTNANNLAEMVLHLIAEKNTSYGLYHYSNLGETSWHGFAQAILKISGKNLNNLTESNAYTTKAERPKYSVLSKHKVQKTFNIKIGHWLESLQELMRETKICNPDE